MSNARIEFDCEELTTSTRYGNSSVTVTCESANLTEIVNSAGISSIIDSVGDVDEILDCISVGDVITWLNNQGYEVMES